MAPSLVARKDRPIVNTPNPKAVKIMHTRLDKLQPRIITITGIVKMLCTVLYCKRRVGAGLDHTSLRGEHSVLMSLLTRA